MIHLHLQPEIEAQLAAEAKARGIQLDRYVEEIVAAHTIQSIEHNSENAAYELQLEADLQQGQREIAEGKTRSAEEVFADLHRQYDIRG